MSLLFLTGPSGVGKSTILARELSRCPVPVSGFFTQRQLSPKGETCGFRLLPWDASSPRAVTAGTLSGQQENLFIQRTPQGRVFRPEVFEALGLSLLSCPSPVLCLDEIGGGELLVPAFRLRLYELLAAHPCCLGVIKSPSSLSSMRARVALKGPAEEELARLYAFLETLPDCRILPVNTENREAAGAAAREFLKERILL